MADNGHYDKLTPALVIPLNDSPSPVIVLADIDAYWAAVERGGPRGLCTKSTGA